MKIVKPGRDRAPAWPVGHELTCKTCGCVFEVEAGDSWTIVENYWPRRAELACPACTAVAIYRQARHLF